MIVTPIRSPYKPADAVKSIKGGRTFADLLGEQANSKANDNPAMAVTRKVPQGDNMSGQFFDVLA